MLNMPIKEKEKKHKRKKERGKEKRACHLCCYFASQRALADRLCQGTHSLNVLNMLMSLLQAQS